MSRDLSIEHADFVFFSTSRTMNSRLWFVNNAQLHYMILAFLARYQEMYGVVIYAFIIMGNHFHLLAKFPKKNKAKFFKNFNWMITKLTNTHVEQFEGGRLWGRPARSQIVADDEAVKNRFFYTALNPVRAGLCKDISGYNGYNSFNDAVTGRQRTFKIFHRHDYSNRKRYNAKLTREDCMTEHTLVFSRLPGYEGLSQKAYAELLRNELSDRTKQVVKERKDENKGFANKQSLRTIERGAKPRMTKTSVRDSKRPLIFASTSELKKQMLEWYFDLVARYRVASQKFRAGALNVIFPDGTYRPFLQVS
ncbi:MAG: transposase [Bdellovibrionota bacterium]